MLLLISDTSFCSLVSDILYILTRFATLQIYRETTENEKQTLLKDLREAEARNGYRGDRMISNLDHDREGSSKSSTENMLGKCHGDERRGWTGGMREREMRGGQLSGVEREGDEMEVDQRQIGVRSRRMRR